jgi:clan AA aspartic protease (TIGR02281 family)
MTANRTSRILAGVLCVVLTKTTAIRADGNDATSDNVFQADGLLRQGNLLVLQAESDLHQRVWSLQQADEAVRGATSTHRSLVPTETRGIETLHQLSDQFDEVDKSLDRLKDKKDDASIDTYNEGITQLDEIRARIITEQEMLNGLMEREGQVEEARARFIGGVMDMQAKAGVIARTYSALANDAALKGVIARANADVDSPLTLGPSMQFTNDRQFLDDAAQKIVSASVAVQKTNTVGGLHVQPMINGKLAVSMVWDSGCTLTQLSSQTAAALGVKLTDQNETTESIIASGAKIKGKLALLDSVQLGPFTLHGVLCDVIEGDEVVPDLLGNSFQGHFLSRLDQQSGRLQLTPIDSSVEIGTISEPGASAVPRIAVSQNQPPARPKDFDLARLATATASSTLDGSSPRGAIDGIVAGAPDSPRYEWASDQPTGSITLTWNQPVSVSSAKLWDRVDGTDHIVSGQMVFDDGSTVPFGELPAGGLPLELNFPPRTIRWIRFEILTVSAGTEHPGFAEICLFQ